VQDRDLSDSLEPMSRRGWLFFLAMAVIWGLPYLLIRVAVRQLDPGVLVLARTAPAAALLWPLVLARRQFAVMLANWRWIVVFGVIEFGVPWYLMASAEKHITSSLTSLLICCVPLFSILVQRLHGPREHVAKRRLAGLGVGAMGVLLLVGLGVNSGSVTWIGAMLVVCLGYTLGPAILAAKLTHVPGPTIVCGATTVVALAWIPWSFTHWPTRVNAETISSIAVLSILCTAGAFLCFFELVKEVGASRATVVTYVNTAIAVVLGIAVLNEPLTAGIALGFPLVLVGSVLATSTPATGQLEADSAPVVR